MSVFAMVSAMAGFVKVRYLMDKAIIDNLVFRCHYRITSAMLFVSCVLVTANNLIGKFSSLKIYFRRESVSLIMKMGWGVLVGYKMKRHRGVIMSTIEYLFWN
jgi:hypothetical protein